MASATPNPANAPPGVTPFIQRAQSAKMAVIAIAGATRPASASVVKIDDEKAKVCTSV
jgi:hypothetical protein